MRFLADENFPLASVWQLREAGHDALAAAEIMPGSKDEHVLAFATQPANIVLGLNQVEGLRLEGRYTVIDPPRIRQRPLP